MDHGPRPDRFADLMTRDFRQLRHQVLIATQAVLPGSPRGLRQREAHAYFKDTDADALFPKRFAILDALDPVANDLGRTVIRVGLNWVLRQPAVTGAVIGGRSRDDLPDHVGSVGWAWEPGQVERLERGTRPITGIPCVASGWLSGSPTT